MYIYILKDLLIMCACVCICACLYIHVSVCTSASECVYGVVSRCLRRLEESVKFLELELTGSARVSRCGCLELDTGK